MNWGMIGCGTIGERRALALPAGVKLVSCFDPNQERAGKISGITGCSIAKAEDEVLDPSKVQAVLVATINSAIIPIVKKACERGLHVLVEKPVARSFSELSELNPGKSIIKVGFNHRFHPAFFDLLSEIKKNPDDSIMFIRAQYGNGARLGFDQEWRSKVELSGGGELLDQGVHVIDLASVLLPELSVMQGYSRTHYWNMPVDDNTWGILANPQGATFSFHVSSSEWKNEFRFEVYTRQRKYQWLGLGRSYGPEKLFIHKMKSEMGPPETEERCYPSEDNSWLAENTNFLHAIQGKAEVNGGYRDALHSLKMVQDIYANSMKLHADLKRREQHPIWWQGQ